MERTSSSAAKQLIARLKLLLTPVRAFTLQTLRGKLAGWSIHLSLKMINTDGKVHILAIDVPLPDNNGIIHLETGDYRVCKIVRGTSLYHPWDRSIVDHYVLDEIDVIAECIRSGVSSALEDHYLYDKLEAGYVQSEVMRFIRSNRCIQWVTHTDKMYPDKVYVEAPKGDRDSQYPILDGEEVLDYTTQSQGMNVGLSMFHCEGVEISKDGIFLNAGKMNARILRENLLFPSMSRRRMTAANINATVELVDGDDPWCHHPSYDHGRKRDKLQSSGTLSGRHFNTTLTPWFTYKEQIAISERCAEQMVAKILTQQIVTVPSSIKNFRITVKKGDIVERGTVVAIHPNIKRLGQENDHYKCRVDHGYVREINEREMMFQGERYKRVKILYETLHRIQTGDKITNRAGGKGVVFVLPNKEFPEGVDICASPLAVVKRRNLGTLVEMMANEHALRNREWNTHYEHFSTAPDGQPWIHWLHQQGCGIERPHKWKGQDVGIYSGPLYWVMLDKLSSKARSCVTKHKRFDTTGNPINNGALNGTKIGLSEMSLITAAKGWGKDILDKHLYSNMYDDAAEAVRNLFVCLRS